MVEVVAAVVEKTTTIAEVEVNNRSKVLPTHLVRKNRREEMAATKEEVEQLLRRLFKGGLIGRIPKGRKDAEVFLALAAARVDSQAYLTESEINEELKDWLEGMANPSDLDHVTVRRYLVDLGMVFRDAEGHSYRTNQAVINRYIDVSARTVAPTEILAEVELARAQRRKVNRANG